MATYTFTNEAGDRITTEDPATALNYRNRPGFTEVKQTTKKAESKSDKKD